MSGRVMLLFINIGGTAIHVHIRTEFWTFICMKALCCHHPILRMEARAVMSVYSIALTRLTGVLVRCI